MKEITMKDFSKQFIYNEQLKIETLAKLSDAEKQIKDARFVLKNSQSEIKAKLNASINLEIFSRLKQKYILILEKINKIHLIKTAIKCMLYKIASDDIIIDALEMKFGE